MYEPNLTVGTIRRALTAAYFETKDAGIKGFIETLKVVHGNRNASLEITDAGEMKVVLRYEK